MKRRCPTCGVVYEAQPLAPPFCSDRCRLLDLGAWAAEKYRISSSERPENREQEHSEDDSEN